MVRGRRGSYVDVIVRHSEAATGHKSVPLKTGEALDVLATHRAREAALGSGGAVTARAATAEVRGSNPLSSTRKSAQTDVISSSAE
jgi:hypothetical protein